MARVFTAEGNPKGISVGVTGLRVIHFSRQQISPNYVVLRSTLQSICIPGPTAASGKEKAAGGFRVEKEARQGFKRYRL